MPQPASRHSSAFSLHHLRPTVAVVGASWAALGIGALSFCIGLWRASSLTLSEKGFYFTVLVLGLYAAISLQKCVRDRAEGLSVSMLYYNISWSILGLSVVLILTGLWNATLALSEKGFYAIAFTLSLFAVVVIQKNARDIQYIDRLLHRMPSEEDGE